MSHPLAAARLQRKDDAASGTYRVEVAVQRSESVVGCWTPVSSVVGALLSRVVVAIWAVTPLIGFCAPVAGTHSLASRLSSCKAPRRLTHARAEKSCLCWC